MTLFLPPVLVAWAAALLGLATAVLAAHVSLGLIRHAHDLPPRDRARWLAAAAAVLGSAVWSVPLVAQSGIDAVSVKGFSLLGVIAAWLLAVGIGAASLALATRPPLVLARVLAGASVLGLAVLAMPLLSLWSGGLRLIADTGWGPLGAALLVGQAGALVAFGLFLRGPLWASRWAGLAQLGAASALGLAASVGAWLLGAAAVPGVPGRAPWIDLRSEERR